MQHTPSGEAPATPLIEGTKRLQPISNLMWAILFSCSAELGFLAGQLTTGSGYVHVLMFFKQLSPEIPEYFCREAAMRTQRMYRSKAVFE